MSWRRASGVGNAQHALLLGLVLMALMGTSPAQEPLTENPRGRPLSPRTRRIYSLQSGPAYRDDPWHKLGQKYRSVLYKRDRNRYGKALGHWRDFRRSYPSVRPPRPYQWNPYMKRKAYGRRGTGMFTRPPDRQPLRRAIHKMESMAWHHLPAFHRFGGIYSPPVKVMDPKLKSSLQPAQEHYPNVRVDRHSLLRHFMHPNSALQGSGAPRVWREYMKKNIDWLGRAPGASLKRRDELTPEQFSRLYRMKMRYPRNLDRLPKAWRPAHQYGGLPEVPIDQLPLEGQVQTGSMYHRVPTQFDSHGNVGVLEGGNRAAATQNYAVSMARMVDPPGPPGPSHPHSKYWKSLKGDFPLNPWASNTWYPDGPEDMRQRTTPMEHQTVDRALMARRAEPSFGDPMQPPSLIKPATRIGPLHGPSGAFIESAESISVHQQTQQSQQQQSQQSQQQQQQQQRSQWGGPLPFQTARPQPPGIAAALAQRARGDNPEMMRPPRGYTGSVDSHPLAEALRPRRTMARGGGGAGGGGVGGGMRFAAAAEPGSEEAGGSGGSGGGGLDTATNMAVPRSGVKWLVNPKPTPPPVWSPPPEGQAVTPWEHPVMYHDEVFKSRMGVPEYEKVQKRWFAAAAGFDPNFPSKAPFTPQFMYHHFGAPPAYQRGNIYLPDVLGVPRGSVMNPIPRVQLSYDPALFIGDPELYSGDPYRLVRLVSHGVSQLSPFTPDPAEHADSVVPEPEYETHRAEAIGNTIQAAIEARERGGLSGSAGAGSAAGGSAGGGGGGGGTDG